MFFPEHKENSVHKLSQTGHKKDGTHPNEIRVCLDTTRRTFPYIESVISSWYELRETPYIKCYHKSIECPYCPPKIERLSSTH
jgi:hypothetical protein